MLSRQVFSVERIRYIALRARRLLSSLGCYNVVIRVCDGSQGWPEKICFDAIIVTAAAPSVPEPLIEQLADKGRLIIPVGNKGEQKLLLLRREGEKISQTAIRISIPSCHPSGYLCVDISASFQYVRVQQVRPGEMESFNLQLN